MARFSTIHIKIIGEGRYSYSIPDNHVENEEVDGPKMLGVLHGKTLLGASPAEVMERLDKLDIGGETTVRFEQPL